MSRYRSACELTKDTAELAREGEFWGVFSEYGEKSKRYIEVRLYIYMYHISTYERCGLQHGLPVVKQVTPTLSMILPHKQHSIWHSQQGSLPRLCRSQYNIFSQAASFKYLLGCREKGRPNYINHRPSPLWSIPLTLVNILFSRENMNINWHFQQFLNTEMADVVKILCHGWKGLIYAT